MAKREKRLIKQKEGLLKQIKKHREKIEQESGRKDTTPAYWEREIRDFLEQIEERQEKLETLKKQKNLSKK